MGRFSWSGSAACHIAGIMNVGLPLISQEACFVSMKGTVRVKGISSR